MSQNNQPKYKPLPGKKKSTQQNPQPYLNDPIPQNYNYQLPSYQQQAINPNAYMQQQMIPPPPFVQQQQTLNSNAFVQQQQNAFIQQQPLNSNAFGLQQQQNAYNGFVPQQISNSYVIPPPQQQFQANNMFFQNHYHMNTGKVFKLLNNKEEDKNKQVVAVIVTLHSGGSYDHLFTSVQQKSQEGTRVLVYEASSDYVDQLIAAYQGQAKDQTLKQMMEHIKKIHPDCVVFNWECCGSYSGQNFVEGKDKVFKFVKMVLDKGHMVMFSDFSLKALITDWDSNLLGPNPFVKTSQTSSAFELRFKAGELKQCPSAQLQIVGQMAEGGKCNVAALGGTICYSINKQNLNHQFYKLQLLSISTSTPPADKKYQCQIGQHKGSAGHVLLTFPSGGMMLTSMGHWIELMKIDTSEKKLFQIAQKQYGQQYAQKMKMQYGSLDVNQQKAWISSNAVQFVQNQAPCSNMSKKAYSKY